MENPLNNLRTLSPIDETINISDRTLEILIENSIQALSSCINKEFNKSSGTEEELFLLPDMLGFDFPAKIQLARDLSELLFNCKSKRESILPSQSLESLRNYRPSQLSLTNKDLLKSILTQDSEGIYVSANDAEELLQLIRHFTDISESNQFRGPLASRQRETILISQKLNKMKKIIRGKQDEIDFLEMSNTQLSDTIRLLNRNEEYLDKMLEDSVYETYSAEERIKILSKELEEASDSLEDLMKNSKNEKIGEENTKTEAILEKTPTYFSTKNPFQKKNKE